MDYVMCPSSVPYKMFWYSSNPDVAEVDSEGNVVAKKPGETDIIVACADKYAICHVTDDDYSITVTVNVHDLVLSLGNKATLSLSSTPIQRDFIVENTDSTVVQATISYIRSHYFCEIIALKPGKTTLVFRVEGNNVAPDTCQVTVGRPDGDVTGDGHVDVDDVNALLNVILDLVDNPLAENLDFYDLDKNGAVDIEDVNKLINIILGFSTSSPS